MTKICTKCGKTKDVSEFFKKKAARDGLRERCKSCTRVIDKVRNGTPEYRQQRKKWREENRFQYALTHSKTQSKRRGHTPCLATVEEIKDAFTGYCKICGKEEGKHKLSMDHDHETGQFRFWLCADCNHGIGYFKDSPDLLERAAKLLRKQQRKEG